MQPLYPSVLLSTAGMYSATCESASGINIPKPQISLHRDRFQPVIVGLASYPVPNEGDTMLSRKAFFCSVQHVDQSFPDRVLCPA